MGDTYDADIVAWSQQQADLLRRHAAGERLNDAPDWRNIVEEIEDVGTSALRAVRSHLLQAMLHGLKRLGWSDVRDVPHWHAEAWLQRAEAAEEFTASMRAPIDLPTLYRRAHRALPKLLDGQPPLPLPEACPWTLDDVLGETELQG